MLYNLKKEIRVKDSWEPKAESPAWRTLVLKSKSEELQHQPVKQEQQS
jgi:hypothetical protein